MDYGEWAMGDGVWGVGSGCDVCVMTTGWWEMLRGMCEKSSTHYKKSLCSLLVVKYPRFIAKMYLLAYQKTKKKPLKKALKMGVFLELFYKITS